MAFCKRTESSFGPSFFVRIGSLVACFSLSSGFEVRAEELTAPSEQQFIPKLGSGFPLSVKDFVERFNFSGVIDYQIGDEWGKKKIDSSGLPQNDSVLVRAVQATALFNSATAFYLGKFSGRHLMATNHHVLERDADCGGRTVNFTIRQKKYRCSEMIGSWPEIDFAIFTLDASDSADADLRPVASLFDFVNPVAENMQLLTAGYGIAGNTARNLMVNQNSDCRVVSGQDEFRFMADPDQYNPASYRAWSFATGCSVSHGDSGSAIVGRNSGKVIGLVWTGAIPKDPKIQNSRYIRDLQDRKDEEVWSLLTYAVPASKIKQKLEIVVETDGIAQRHKQSVRDFLSGRQGNISF
jgi:hypothetical protein